MKLKRGDVDYLTGLCSAFDDMPDGAWARSCQDVIEADKRFAGRDPYEVWIAWVEATSVESGRQRNGE